MKTHKEESLTNFKKASGLISKIIKMAEEDKYCVDIMQQNLAAIGLLRSAHQKLMEGHLNSCFLNGMETKNRRKKQDLIKELLQVNKLSNK